MRVRLATFVPGSGRMSGMRAYVPMAGCKTGAPGASAARGLPSAGKGAYSTFTKRSAPWADASSSATMATTGSPWWRTWPRANGGLSPR